MYPPERGMVDVDGTDICGLDIWMACQLSTVPQRPFLFGDSVEQHCVGDTGDSEQIDRAVSLASLTQDLPAADGLDTVVGERGIMLSGGQRQRGLG